MRLLVTGGAGFIGSHFVRQYGATHEITVLDALTYAGRRENLEGARCLFVHGTILDRDHVAEVVRSKNIEAIVNFAAESHVDRSIRDGAPFVSTNVQGALAVFEVALEARIRVVQVSTDEVYGATPPGVTFDESAHMRPSNPYAASKAAADLLALSMRHTHGLDVVITRSANNYGERQYPEKLIPRTIARALAGETLQVHGDGLAERDWIAVEDNVAGIEAALTRGAAGAVYNLGTGSTVTNIDVVRAIAELTGSVARIAHVVDRPGQDRRYALDASRARAELGWAPKARGVLNALPALVRCARDAALAA